MILLVLSDCIGFIAIIPLLNPLEKRSSRVALPGWTSSRKVCKPSSTWSVSPFPLFYGIVTHNVYGSFSLRETMLSLKQPYIEWSDGILSTGYHPIDRQHEWLLTIVNISTWRWWLMIDDWWLMIGGCAFMKRSDPCEHGESSGYLYLWRAGRVERLCVDPLYRWGSHLYESSISLSKWNEWCVIVVNMMNIVDIHSYCSNGECFLMYTKYPQFGVHKKQHDVRKCQ